MNEVNQENKSDASAILPLKRKRGRPRKYPKLDHGHGGIARVPRDQNLGCRENIRVPPVFGGVNGDQPYSTDPVNVANDVTVGQVVHGVIEAAFDAGYLLTVRVGNSETTLRGVVFKPGHYVPVSADNDVAPGIQMIKRNEFSLPRYEIPRSRDRNGTGHAARAANASKAKLMPSMAIQSANPDISRGNVVPVLLQPVHLSNGLPVGSEMSSADIEATESVASKGKEVLHGVHPPNGSTPLKQGVGMASGVQIAASHFHQNPTEAPYEAEAKSMNLPAMPFEKLLTEVIKRVQIPSELTQSNSSSAAKFTEPDSSLHAEDGEDGSDTSQALSVEPLQTLQPGLHNQPEVASRPFENFQTGKMTELLQALQEKMIENQVTQAEEPAVDSRPNEGH